MGGFIGAASRYGVTLGVSRLLGQPTFPWGVLAVNVLGSLLIGVLAGIAEARNLGPGVRLFLFVGVLGGFTTFSAITNDTLTLLRNAALPLRRRERPPQLSPSASRRLRSVTRRRPRSVAGDIRPLLVRCCAPYDGVRAGPWLLLRRAGLGVECPLMSPNVTFRKRPHSWGCAGYECVGLPARTRPLSALVIPCP